MEDPGHQLAKSLTKLNGLIKGHVGPVVFAALKGLEKAGIPVDENKPFQIVHEPTGQEVVFQTPTGPQVGEEVVVEDPKVLRRIIYGALRAGRDRETAPEVEEIAGLRERLSKMNTAEAQRALAFDKVLHDKDIVGKEMPLKNLAVLLGQKARQGGLAKPDPTLDLNAAHLLVKTAAELNYPFVHFQGDIADPQMMLVTIDELRDYDPETAPGMRYPSIPWLLHKQAELPGERVAGLRIGAGPSRQPGPEEISGEDHVRALLRQFNDFLTMEKIPDDESEREQLFDQRIPEVYRNIYKIIEKYMDEGQVDDQTAQTLMDEADRIKNELAQRWKIDFEPVAAEAYRIRETIEWFRYYMLMEQYAK